MFEYFYNEILRRTIIGFGTLFNGISVKTDNQEIRVPLAYGPTQKFLARLNQSPDLKDALKPRDHYPELEQDFKTRANKNLPTGSITTKIIIKGSELKAHKIPPSILTLLDDGTVGVKAIDNEDKVTFYPTKTIKDTIDGMWVSGLPEKVNLIVSGQEYISIGDTVN